MKDKSFKILYVSATAMEAESLVRAQSLIQRKSKTGRIDISLLVTGIGCVSTAWAMKDWIMTNGRPDLAINGGIAGAYSTGFVIGDVVMPVADCFADSGIEDGSNFLTLAEAGIIDAFEFPYKDGILYSDPYYIEKMKNIVRPVRAITVNTATGSESSRRKLSEKFNPDIETMEGATFFYICCRENIPFLALRAISNKVERRNKSNWNISLALNNLSEKLIDVLLMF